MNKVSFYNMQMIHLGFKYWVDSGHPDTDVPETPSEMFAFSARELKMGSLF